MSRRESSTDGGRPRRSRHKVSYNENDAFEDNIVVEDWVEDDREQDEANGDDATEEDDEELEMDEGVDEAEEVRASNRTRNAQRGNADEEEVLQTRRSSTRSNKFRGRMKDDPDSISDLIAYTHDDSKPQKKKRHKAGDDDDEEDSHEDSLSPQGRIPAVHNKPRRRKTKAEPLSEEEDDDHFAEDEAEDDEQEELKIQRIIASRTETRRDWKEICSKMQTSEVDNGSRWSQSSDPKEDDARLGEDTFEERFLVKWSRLSYIHCTWELEEDLIGQVEGAKSYLTTFFRKSINGRLFTANERCDGDYFDPAFVHVDRILDVQEPNEFTSREPKDGEREAISKFGIVTDRNDPDYEVGTGRQFLIKWGSMGYSEATYEFERDLILTDVDYEEEVEKYLQRSEKPSKTEVKRSFKMGSAEMRRLHGIFDVGNKLTEEAMEKGRLEYQKKLEEHVFPNGGQLRDYQAEGDTWLISNYVYNRSAILADEMGLGKTLQTCAFIDLLANSLKRRGPFLIVAPLSTLEHWRREFEMWTNLNTCIYHGNRRDRSLIREYEMAYEEDRPPSAGTNYLRRCHRKAKSQHEKIWMAQVVITTPETLCLEDYGELTAIAWEVLVVDEAHRLKSATSKLAVNLRDRRFHFNHTVLLTGTPIQNNMQELFALLSFIDPDTFDDDVEFMDKFGDMKSKEAVDELHETIRPYILRRLKEDVEKSVPPKEETLVEVELTMVQKQYYRALYEKNVNFLHRNKKKALDGPSISNLAMQLRKCCLHPFLLRGIEEELKKDRPKGQSEGDFLVKSSGKLVFLDKLLPALKKNGHRVLIFSQFKIMLDILEDYLHSRDHKVERIDGSITGKKRQQAIDRYQAPAVEGKDPPFIMLLSTRAGGVGINLTAADTCIIFDSDWNPQNDLQAQARCHRIGQTKSVKVYRLLTRKTYEMHAFHMSSMKMGLDQAVLKGFENNGEEAMSKDEVEKLLRHGAFDIFSEEKAGTAEAESNGFIEADLESILARRSKTVIHENTGSKSGAKGSTFSKASFFAPKPPEAAAKKGAYSVDVDVDDPDFWKKMVGEGTSEVDPALELVGKKRARREANYSEKAYERNFNRTLQLSDNSGQSEEEEEESASDSETETEESDNEVPTTTNKSRKERSKWGRKKEHRDQWDKTDVQVILKALQLHGYGYIPWEEFCEKISIPATKYDLNEIRRMSWSIILTAVKEVADDDLAASKKRAEKAAEKAAEKRREEVAAATAATMGNDEGGVLGRTDSLNVEYKDTLQTCLDKILTAQANRWIRKALVDAAMYTELNKPRSKVQVQKLLKTGNDTQAMQDANALFVQNVWPALRSRGWKVEVTTTKQGEARRYVFKSQQFKTIRSVLQAVPSVHPELQNMTSKVLSSVVSLSDQEAESQVIDYRKGYERPTPSSLASLLEKFAPSQLVADRVRPKKLPLQKRLLNNCSFMATAHLYLKMVDLNTLLTDEALTKLTNLMCLDKRSTPPHPEWSTKHDAILIFAIVKHGWIEDDSMYRAITEDNELKWGAPFQVEETRKPEEAVSVIEQMGDVGLTIFRKAAQRAANFLNAEEGMIDALKGFKKQELISTYGLTVRTAEAHSREEGKWHVDDHKLSAQLKQDDPRDTKTDPLGLPPKKDLVRRAKAILSRLPVVGEAHKPAAEKKKLDLNPNEVDPPADHGFTILNQSDPSNFLLAELLRSLTKVSFNNSDKRRAMGRTLRSYVHNEIHARVQDMEQVIDTSTVARATSMEIMRLKNDIIFANRFIISQPVQAKNVLRVILGQRMLKPRNSSERLLPFEGLAALPTTQSKNGQVKLASTPKKLVVEAKKKWKQPKERNPIGDRAIASAMTRGVDCDALLGQPSPEEIWLNAHETLLLTVMCSQGIPIWTRRWQEMIAGQQMVPRAIELSEQGHPCLVYWEGLGRVNEAAANLWYQTANAKLRARRQSFNELYGERNHSAEKTRFLEKLKRLEIDSAAKERTLQIAKDYRREPQKLAMKCVMLLESLACNMGPRGPSSRGPAKSPKNQNKSENGLGPKVLAWLCEEVLRWATSLKLLDINQKPLHYTAQDFRHEPGGDGPFVVASVLNKKECREVFSQIAEQARARSLFTKYDARQMRHWIERSNIEMIRDEDEWEYQPPWWGMPPKTTVDQDYELLATLMDSGWSGIDESSFRATDDDDQELSRAALQVRANMLVRRLHSIDETQEILQSATQYGDTGRGFFGPKHGRPKVDDEIKDSSDSDVEVLDVVVTGGKRPSPNGKEEVVKRQKI